MKEMHDKSAMYPVADEFHGNVGCDEMRLRSTGGHTDKVDALWILNAFCQARLGDVIAL